MCLACHVFFLQLWVTYWARADLLAPLYVMFFFCVYITFPHCVLGHVCNLIVSIPDLCLLLYFAQGQYAVPPVRLKPATLYLDSSTLPLGTALAYCVVIMIKISDYCYYVNFFFIFC